MTQYDYNNCGFIRVASVAPEVRIGDSDFNAKTIIAEINNHINDNIILFPELSLTGYTCGDLFEQRILLDSVKKNLCRIAAASQCSESLIIVGAPIEYINKLYNCAIFINKGEILGISAKKFLPNYGEFYEKRWFASGNDISNGFVSIGDKDIPICRNLLIECYQFSDDTITVQQRDTIEEYSSLSSLNARSYLVGAEICEDLWTPIPPSSSLVLAGAEIIVNLSASNDTIGKHRYRRDLILQQSARCRCGYIYASAGEGESSTDLSFSGYTAIACNGKMLSESEPFSNPPQFSESDIDMQLIDHDRRHFNSFADNAGDNINDIVIIKATNKKSGESTIHSDNNNDDNAHLDPLDNENFPLVNDNDIKLIGIHPEPHPFVPKDPSHRDANCKEIIEIQCHALGRRLKAINCRKIVIGVSGGLDSTLALLVAVRTFDNLGFDRTGIIGITMPGLATTSKTRNNANMLMELLGITSLEIPIGGAIDQHFNDIGQDPDNHDAAYENSQARERTQIIMDYANKVGGIVLGTGDLSELALGWCTYNGDHMSMYAVNASIPKTLVKYLVEWFAARDKNKRVSDVLTDIVNTPISPELIPSNEGEDVIAQKTEDLVGPYELHDFFLFHILRNSYSPRKIYILAKEAFAGKYDEITIKKWLRNFYRRFFSQQFKRSCMPDGPKVGSVCLSPRGDWRMPSDASATLWLAEIDKV